MFNGFGCTQSVLRGHSGTESEALGSSIAWLLTCQVVSLCPQDNGVGFNQSIGVIACNAEKI